MPPRPDAAPGPAGARVLWPAPGPLERAASQVNVGGYALRPRDDGKFLAAEGKEPVPGLHERTCRLLTGAPDHQCLAVQEDLDTQFSRMVDVRADVPPRFGLG